MNKLTYHLYTFSIKKLFVYLYIFYINNKYSYICLKVLLRSNTMYAKFTIYIYIYCHNALQGIKKKKKTRKTSKQMLYELLLLLLY